MFVYIYLCKLLYICVAFIMIYRSELFSEMFKLIIVLKGAKLFNSTSDLLNLLLGVEIYSEKG